VNRDQLPVWAAGTPRVTRQGKARNGQAYAVVSFREFTANGGQRMKPINIGFANVDQIGKLPQIKEVR
jgi:hypothetical protein